ncbi:MAG: glycosyltransferase [bacterium]
MPQLRYAIISAVRNEATNLPQMLTSIQHQYILPQHHLIVDDGSIDDSLRILQAFAHTQPWIRVFLNPHRNKRTISSHVDALNYALQKLWLFDDWDYLSVLDGDVVLEKGYYSKLLTIMRAEHIDIISGVIAGERTEEPRGCGRIYTREFMEKLKLFPSMPAWDTFHNYIAKLHKRKILLVEKAQMHPLRRTAASLKSAYRTGVSCAILRYFFPYLVGRAVIKGIRGLIMLFTFIIFRVFAYSFKISKRFKHFIQIEQKRKLNRILMSYIKNH